jgi:hypothetical protein
MRINLAVVIALSLLIAGLGVLAWRQIRPHVRTYDLRPLIEEAVKKQIGNAESYEFVGSRAPVPSEYNKIPCRMVVVVFRTTTNYAGTITVVADVYILDLNDAPPIVLAVETKSATPQ